MKRCCQEADAEHHHEAESYSNSSTSLEASYKLRESRTEPVSLASECDNHLVFRQRSPYRSSILKVMLISWSIV